MQRMSAVFRLVITALFAALVTVGTMVIQIPTPATQGYINFGDTLIFISGVLLGPLGGLFAGGVGSWLADLLSGYAHYAPWTLVIKGLEGLLVGLLAHRAYAAHQRFWTPVMAMLVAGAWMTLGYFIAENIMYGWVGAVGSLVGNSVQATGSLVMAALLLPQVAKAWRRFQK